MDIHLRDIVKNPLPASTLRTALELAESPTAQTFPAAQIKRGEALADSHSCTDCHSPKFDGAGR